MQEGPLILAVDDTDVDLKILQKILEKAGYRVVTGSNGQDALDLFEAHKPELVLLDISMPVVDGFEVARRIRAQGGPYEPPIIFITAATDEDLMTRCIEAGGNDFISKPFKRAGLLTRIESYQHLGAAYREQREYQKELEYYQALLEREQVVAQSIFDSVLHSDQLEEDNLRTLISASSVFNGDIVLAAKAPGGHMHLLVGDFPGHGLSASIGSLPTAEIFFTMTAKGFELVEIIAEINKRLRLMLPMDIFLAACLVEIDASGKTAHVWNGGLPDMLLVRAVTGHVETIGSRHMPLTILKNNELDRSLDRVALEPDDRLYLFTDGLIQTQSPEGEEFSLERVHACLGDPEGGFDRVVRELEGHLAGHRENDQTTLLEYRVVQQLEEASLDGPVQGFGQGISVDWRFDIRLDPPALRSFDPRPMLTQLMVEVQGLNDHRERLFTIVAELFSNALEHGLMGLDSQLKASPEGFAQYYLERETRLERLSGGTVDIRLRHVSTEQGGMLTIEMEDSGPGFDYEKRADGALSTSGFSGRGIGLLRHMCDNVTYFAPGNRAQVTYHWVKSGD